MKISKLKNASRPIPPGIYEAKLVKNSLLKRRRPIFDLDMPFDLQVLSSWSGKRKKRITGLTIAVSGTLTELIETLSEVYGVDACVSILNGRKIEIYVSGLPRLRINEDGSFEKVSRFGFINFEIPQQKPLKQSSPNRSCTRNKSRSPVSRKATFPKRRADWDV